MRIPLTLNRGLTRANARSVRNASGPELSIYDEIGFWGITASDVARDLAAFTGQRVTVRVNSPGGEVFDGIAIYNLLRGHVGGVDVVVDGLAASAASFIAMAGETVTMRPHSRMMIHDAIGICLGNAAAMLETATLLDDLSENIAGIYAERAAAKASAGGGDEEPDEEAVAAAGDVKAWRKRMKAETWLSPEQALDLGLVDVAGDPPSDAEGDDEDGAGGDGEDEQLSPMDRWKASIAYQAAKNTRDRAAAPQPAPAKPARPAARPAAAAAALDDIRAAITKGISR